MLFDVRIVTRSLTLPKLIRASRPSFLSDSQVSSGLGVKTLMEVDVWAMFPSLKPTMGPKDTAQTDSTFRLSSQISASHHPAAPVVLFQATVYYFVVDSNNWICFDAALTGFVFGAM